VAYKSLVLSREEGKEEESGRDKSEGRKRIKRMRKTGGRKDNQGNAKKYT